MLILLVGPDHSRSREKLAVTLRLQAAGVAVASYEIMRVVIIIINII